MASFFFLKEEENLQEDIWKVANASRYTVEEDLCFDPKPTKNRPPARKDKM